MNRWDADTPDSRQSLDHDEFESVIDSDLSRRCPGPDLTESIMQRLGYQRADDVASIRSDMWQRWGRRLSVAAAAGVALFVGVFVHQAGPDARSASDLSIPSAIQNDIDRHGQSVGQLIQTIQQLTPTPRHPGVPAPALGMPADSASDSANDSSSFGPTMDPAAAAPFQWV